MGNKKGYVPSEETKRKVSEALKKAYTEGRGRKNYVPTEETKQKQSDAMQRAWDEGRRILTGAALQQSLAPKKSEAERKARKIETQTIWRANNPERMAGYKQKYNPTYYGLTNEQYEEQAKAQDYKCAICRQPQQGGFRLAIDHDHTCCPERSACEKCRRALLCSNCNQALGLVHESSEILQQMILYLQSFKKTTGELQCPTHLLFDGKSAGLSN